MRQKRTSKEIQAWLKRQGLQANPIESINHRANGDTEIWLISLAEPLLYPAPRRRRVPPSSNAPSSARTRPKPKPSP